MKTLQSESGFTLIEALMAMVILAVGIFSLYSMQITSVRQNSHANRMTEASTLNSDQVERMIGMDYGAAIFTDTNGNGTGKADDNDSGVDGSGNNFGLDDIDGADGTFTTEDGHYSLYWNVANDVPVLKLKTIRVHVQDRQRFLSNPVSFTYIKTDLI